MRYLPLNETLRFKRKNNSPNLNGINIEIKTINLIVICTGGS